MFETKKEDQSNIIYKVPSYINKNIDEVRNELNNNNINTIIIGDGYKIIKQYPNKNTKLVHGDKVYLLTNSNNYKMPNMSGWSRYEVIKFCEFIGMDYSFEGYGYVVSQSIKNDNKIDSNSKLEILLGNIKEN